jgi:hypothetical protein
MTPEASIEYHRAIEEAANSFMKIMALRGFNVRDYPQNFVAQMQAQSHLAFEISRHGAHQNADALVTEMLRTAPEAPRVVPQPSKAKVLPFAALRRRMA